MKSFLRVAGRLAGVVALTMVLAGIAQAQIDDITPDPYQKSKEPVYLTPQTDHALLYVARPEYVRFIGLSPFKVFVDDKAAGWLTQRSYLAVQVEPGHRLLWGPGRNEAQRFDFEGGKTYLLVLAEKYRLVNTGRSSVRQLDATWWIVRGPAEIKNMVSADKLEYVTTSDDAMAELNKESAKKYVKTNDKAQDPLEMALPVSFEKVMYRHAKKDFSLKTWEDTGVLTIGREGVEFKGAKMTVVIPMKDLQWFTYDTIVSKTVGLIFANQAVGEAQWNILSFMSEGQEQTIAFKDGRHLSNGADTKLIYKALQTAAPEKAQSSAKAAAAVAALADNSPQPNATAETQPSVPAPAQEASDGSQPAASSHSDQAAPNSPAAASPEQTPAVQASAPRRGTLASELLQRDTFRTVSLIDNANSDCTARRRVLKTEVTREPSGVKIKHNRMVAGSWEERWTIDRCGTPVAYDLLFSSDGHGGTNIATKLMPDTEQKPNTAPPPQAAPAATPVQAPPLAPSPRTRPQSFVVLEGGMVRAGC